MKRLFSLLMAILLLAVLVVPVSAGRLTLSDSAELLTGDQRAQLESEMAALKDRYEMDVVILTIDSIGGRDIEAYADDYYDNGYFGVGPDNSGVLLVLVMDTREWAISTCGDAIYALTDYGIEALFRTMAGYLSDGEYYAAFSVYLDELPRYFEAFEDGEPIDGYHGGYNGPGSYVPGSGDDVIYYDREPGLGDYLRILCIALTVGAVAGGITLLVMRGQMNTARQQTGASSYLLENTVQMNKHLDLFLYSRVSRTRRQQSSSGGGGGSRVHHSSGGRSHGGGHGRF